MKCLHKEIIRCHLCGEYYCKKCGAIFMLFRKHNDDISSCQEIKTCSSGGCGGGLTTYYETKIHQ